MIEKEEDIYCADNIAISIVVGRYRMVEGKPRRINQTVYQNISLLPSDNVNEDSFSQQLKRLILEYENKSKEEDKKKEI